MPEGVPASLFYQENLGGFLMMTVRNEIKAQIVRAGYTMQQVVDRLHEEYNWSDSVSNLSAKLQRESIRYKEVVELADVLGYDIYWGPNKCHTPAHRPVPQPPCSGWIPAGAWLTGWKRCPTSCIPHGAGQLPAAWCIPPGRSVP